MSSHVLRVSLTETRLDGIHSIRRIYKWTNTQGCGGGEGGGGWEFSLSPTPNCPEPKNPGPPPLSINLPCAFDIKVRGRGGIMFSTLRSGVPQTLNLRAVSRRVARGPNPPPPPPPAPCFVRCVGVSVGSPAVPGARPRAPCDRGPDHHPLRGHPVPHPGRDPTARKRTGLFFIG